MNKRSYVISALIIVGMIYSMAIGPGGGPGGATQSEGGRIVVLADSGPICDHYWSTSARTFTLNIFGWLTEFSPGKRILGNPTNYFGWAYVIDHMVDTLQTNGYTVNIIDTSGWTQALLETYDAVFIVIDKYSIDDTLLIKYVNGGGGVFLIGGTRHSGPDKHKEFLLHFGMSLQEHARLGKELLTNFVPHSVTNGVSELKMYYPTPIVVHSNDPLILATWGGWNWLVVYSKESTIGVPAVTIVSPNGGEYWKGTQTITWTATDPQGDPLTYTVYYSPNGGQTWNQLATGLTEPSYLWDTTTVAIGTNYLIQVMTTDGTYIGVDLSNGPFEIQQKPPGGCMQWERTYGGSEDDVAGLAIQTTDGGFVLSGWTTSYGAGGTDAWLVKTDARGEVVWMRTYGGLGYDRASAVIEMADGGFILAGFTNSYGAGGFDAWLVKTDARGEVEWTRTYGGPYIEKISAAIQTTDGGFALAGRTGPDAWLVKTDARGVMQWSQRYGGGDTCSSWAVSVIETLDGGFVLPMIRSFSRGVGARVVKTDVNGHEEWWIKMSEYSLCWVYSGIQTVDGGFAFVGSYGIKGDSVLVKTDTTGNEEWQQDYGAPAGNVIQTTDGGFALAGYTGKDFWLAKIDNQGTMEWQQTYGGSGNDQAFSVIETADGGFALAGQTASYGAGGYDAWLVKTIPPETTPPELSAPEDLTFEEGATGHVITWVVGDRCPGTYAIYTNSEQVASGSWTNGTITWNVDGLVPSTYNVTLVVRDAAHNCVSDTVWVTVTAPETPPETLLLPELLMIRTMVLLSLVTLITLGVRRKYHRKLLEGH